MPLEKFSGKVKLTEAWQEFEDSLITRDVRDENKSVAYKTDEASLFFGEDRLLDQHLNLRFWNSVPALLGRIWYSWYLCRAGLGIDTICRY